MKCLKIGGESQRAFFLKFLAEANKIEVRSIVEIGVWKGMNAFALRHLFPDAHLYLVDPWSPNIGYFSKGSPPSREIEDYECCYQMVKKIFADDPKVSVIRKTSVEGAKEVPNEVDLAFIDGDHSYESVKEDIAVWRKRVRKGGLLSGHDYSPEFPGVMRAVDESLKEKFIVGRDTVWATIYH